MSRYAWKRNFENEHTENEIVVGWDNPMRTFFAQINRVGLSDDSEEERSIFWIGGNFDEYGEIAEFIEACPFDIPEPVIERLKLDQQGNMTGAAAISLPAHVQID